MGRNSKQEGCENEAGMLNKSDPLMLQHIGTVQNDIQEPEYIQWSEVVSQIVIHPEYLEALHTLDAYSHLIVLFWMHEVCYSKTRHVPQGKHEAVPEVGIFACHCPYRPNPIGSTTVPILDITGNVLTVKGLDAIDMTPVIDIKPYTPQYDFACKMDNQLKAAICRNVRIPEWIF